MKTVRAAATWLDRVGVAALLPGADLVLPSLWEALTGTRAVEWGVRRDDGKFEFTPEMARCWEWKDELPAKRLALAGKHFGRWAALVAPRLVPHAWTVAGDRRESLTGLQHEIAAAVGEQGPLTMPQLRALVPDAEKKHVEQLQRAFVLTNSHVVEQEQGWPAIAVDLVGAALGGASGGRRGARARARRPPLLGRAVGGRPRRRARLARQALAGGRRAARRPLPHRG